MAEPASTIRELLRWGISKLDHQGIDNPRLDAEVLLAHALSRERTALYRDPETPLEIPEREAYATLIERRVKREPVAYITGCKEFRALPFKLTRDVLIPRPETELLLDEAFKACAILLERKNHLRILELGTGSGILAVSLAKEVSGCTIVATDISSKIIEAARDNARLHEVQGSIRFVVGDLFHPLAPRGEGDRFDCILFNPPYLSDDDWRTVQPEIKNYEPIDSLLGGHDGLDFYRAIIPEAGQLLGGGGYLLLETGRGQSDPVKKLIAATTIYREVHAVKDLAGINRVVSAERTRR